MTNTLKAAPWLRKLVFLTLIMVACVIILGSWTRLVDAGLGCPDWPGCYGSLVVPQTPEAIAQAEALFPDSPVDLFKGRMELTHRYLASLLGLCILIIAVGAWRYRHTLYFPFKQTQALLGLVIVQGAFGAWTVTWKLWPQVVTAHLLGGFTIASMLAVLYFSLRRMGREVAPLALTKSRISLVRLGLLALGLTLGQIFLGGWMSANYAALACAALPDCNGAWWPVMDFAEGFNFTQQLGPNYLGGLMDIEGRVAIHMMHRIGALVLSIYILWFAWVLKQQPDMRLHRLSRYMVVILLIQLGLGLGNVYWSLPLSVAVAHNFIGSCLFVTLVLLNYVLISKRTRVIIG